MTPPEHDRVPVAPKPVQPFIATDAAVTLPSQLAWQQGMWVGPSSGVNYPDDGHDLLPVNPDNWWYAHRAAVVVRALARIPVWPRVLWDVGGGTGLMEPALRADGWQTVVVEPVASAAARAIDRADLVISAPLEYIRLPSSSVPAIGMFDVLEHLDDPVATLRECARVLMPGGVLIATVPSHPWLWSDTDRAAGHQLRYTPRALRRQGAQAGLRLIESRRFFVALVPGAAAIRLTRRGDRDDSEVLAKEQAMLNPPPRRERVLKWLVSTDRLTSGPVRSPVGLSLLGVFRKAS